MKWKKVKIPTRLEFAYGDYAKRCFQIKNGWIVVVLKNNSAIFYNENFLEMCVPKFKKVDVAPNGLFMITAKDGYRAIFDESGKKLSVGDLDCMLFDNGWYRIQYDNEHISLFNDKGVSVGHKLRTAEVFPDGRYYMSCILPWEDGDTIPGLYDADGSRIHFTNDQDITVLKNGWYILDNCLYDNKGNLCVGTANGRHAYKWLLKLYGSFMRRKV